MAKNEKKPSIDVTLTDRADLGLEADLTQRLAIALAAGQEDSVTAAEQAAGVSRNELDLNTEFALGQRFLQMKADKAEFEHDTYHGMKWDYFLDVLQSQGFEQAYAHHFEYNHRVDEFSIWVKKEKGFLLQAQSYHGKTEIHSTTLYYELGLPAPEESLTEEQHALIFVIRCQGTSAPLKVDGSIVAYFNLLDAQNGLVKRLHELEESGLSTNVPWQYVLPQELWHLKLYDFADEKNKEDQDSTKSWQIKNKRTLEKLPLDVQEMVGWTRT